MNGANLKPKPLKLSLRWEIDTHAFLRVGTYVYPHTHMCTHFLCGGAIDDTSGQ